MKSKVISCVVTGIEKRVSASTINKKALKFGTEENFEKHFVCNEAKKLLKQRLSPEEVQLKLKPEYVKAFSINYEVLARLKLLKKAKTGKARLSGQALREQQEATEKNQREWYERQEKLKTCSKTWVEEMTGGPNKCQVPYGGTCIRPDIYMNQEYNVKGRCSPCPYNEHCLCTNKELK